jgi:predicted nuclease of predicted toxin-antitoxin system
VRLLLDECVPRRLARELPGHDVSHVVDLGWSSKKNGELLSIMQTQGFQGFLTVDQNLQYQQALAARRIAVVVAIVRRNRLQELRPLIPQILAALATIAPGDVVRVSA